MPSCADQVVRYGNPSPNIYNKSKALQTIYMIYNGVFLFFSGFGPFRKYLVNPSWEAVKVVYQFYD